MWSRFLVNGTETEEFKYVRLVVFVFAPKVPKSKLTALH